MNLKFTRVAKDKKMDSVVLAQEVETNDRRAQFLQRVERGVPLLADLSRADILVGVPSGESAIQVVAQAQPHSVAPIHRTSMIGEKLTQANAYALFRAIVERQYARSEREYVPQSNAGTLGEGTAAPVVQEAYPIEDEAGRILGGMLIETNLLESERLKRRSEVFQRALKSFQQLVQRGEPEGIDNLTPFGEHDGIVVVDADGIIRYMSGIAMNLHRIIGYSEPLVGRPISYLETQDDELISRSVKERRCNEVEVEERGRVWIKKIIPIMRTERASLFGGTRAPFSGAILLIHDDTKARQRARELLIKTTMIKEMHHRVKNDLQTVASVLRMQSRRLQTTEAKGALAEAVNRILSIAVIHEFLSEQDTHVINIRDVAQRIVQQMQFGVLDPERRISFTLAGPNVYLPARQATSCALVINELLQNALEHGYDSRQTGGTISLIFEDQGDTVELKVHDDGRELPPDFSLEHVDSLGLRIVHMLVTEDLKGQIDLKSDQGVSAIVRFPKIPLHGGEEWSEPA